MLISGYASHPRLKFGGFNMLDVGSNSCWWHAAFIRKPWFYWDGFEFLVGACNHALPAFLET